MTFSLTRSEALIQVLNRQLSLLEAAAPEEVLLEVFRLLEMLDADPVLSPYLGEMIREAERLQTDRLEAERPLLEEARSVLDALYLIE